jgi:signal transduction histidine kinase
VKAVLDDAVVKIREVTQADAAVIHLIDEQGCFRHSSHFGLSPECAHAMPITATETDIAALVVLSGQPHIAEDIAADADLQPGLLAQEGFKSAAYLPLTSAGQTFGLMIIAGRERGQISPRQVDLFTAITHQIAVALENAHLYEAQKVRATRLRTLASLNQLVSSSLDADEVLGRISLAAADLMGAVVVEFWIADEATRSLKLHITSASSLTADRLLTSLSYGQGAAGWVASHRTVLNLPDVLDDTRIKTPAWFRDHGLSSGLWVPLVFQDELLGVLSMLGRTPFGQSADDQGLVDAFAAQAAVAIRNARLYASTQAQASALKMKNAELDAFAYSVSHDLKAPLVTIQGMAGMLLEDYGGQLDTGGRHYLERLQANAQQMELLISDLLTLSRIGREGHAGEMVHVTELVNELLMEMEGLILARAAKVILGDVGELYGVRTQLRQVFANLISNGIKYAGAAGSPMVEIGMVDRGDFMECYVRDNGIGIDPAYHEKIFEMFQRLKEVEAEGTGVGLAIVKKIIDAAGGRIWVESTKGQGATFRFTWPKRNTV